MTEKLHDMFNGSDCPPDKVKRDYLEGKLSVAMKRSFELHLAGCEMCSDEIEGMSVINDPARIESVVSEINAEIDRKTGQKKGTVIFLEPRWRAAAAIVILIIVSAVILMNISVEKDNKQTVSDNIQKHPGKKKIPGKETSSDSLEYAETEESLSPDEGKTEATKIAGQSDRQDSQNNTRKTTGSTQTLSGEGYFYKDAVEEENALKVDKLAEFEAAADEDDGVFANLISPKEQDIAPSDKKETEKNEVLAREEAVTESTILVADNVRDERQKSKEDRSGKKNSVEKTTSKSVTTVDGKVITATGGITTTSDSRNGGSQAPASVAYEKYDENFRSSADLPVTKEEKALQDFDNRDYSGAIASFGDVLETKPGDHKALYYSAVSYIALGKPEEAIKLLSDIVTDKTSPYYSQARYNLALAYKQKGDLAKARQLCNEINDSNDAFKEKAGEMLLEIGNQ